MKSLFGAMVLAVLLAGAGALLWTIGVADRDLARLQTDIATMRFGAAGDDAAAVEARLGSAIVARGGRSSRAEAAADRATAEYWLGTYGKLGASRAGGPRDAASASDALVAANAAYRAVDGDKVDRAAAVARLEAVIKAYAEVLRADPGNVDAAYNYEFVVREKNALAKATGPVAKSAAPESPSTIHGRPGAPPKGVNMGGFRVLVPQRSDERNDNPEAGKGGVTQRKG